MIRALIAYALNNRFMVLALVVILLLWGAVSFHNLPVEAYPDVANNYVQIITQWPGHAAEEIEQQVTTAPRSRCSISYCDSVRLRLTASPAGS